HPIVGDLWSLRVVLDEIRPLYPALCAGAAPVLPPLTTQYRDFVRWQADLLAGPEGERLGGFWERQLAGVPVVLALPTDRPRPSRLGQGGNAVPCRLDANLTRRLRDLAAAEQVTLFTVLLAAWQTLLGRCTGQEDFVIGSPFAGRSRPEFAGVVGYFINLLPLRADLTGDPTLRTLLRRVGDSVLNALQHQDYPFALLVERLHVPRDPGRPPLVQAAFMLEKALRPGEEGASRFAGPQAGAHLNVGGLQFEPYPLE